MAFLTDERKIFVNVDKDTAKFAVSVNGDRVLHPGIEGKLVRVYEQKGKMKDETPFHKLVLDLEDNGETYAVAFGMTSSAARNIINSLLTVDELYGWLKLRSYQKDGYNKLYLEYNHNKTEWKFAPTEFPKAEAILLQSGKPAKDAHGEDLKDNSKVIEFWDKALKDLFTKFGSKSNANVNHATGEVEDDPINEQFADQVNEKQPF